MKTEYLIVKRVFEMKGAYHRAKSSLHSSTALETEKLEEREL